MKNKKKKAFTLAEVLITLAIIGIVAAITIPTLMANYQKVQYVAELKKAYAEMTEALKLMANDSGCPDNLVCTGLFDDNVDSLSFGNECKKYFKLSKDCGVYNSSDERTKCFSDSVSDNYDGSDPYGYGRYNLNNGYRYNFITADGFAISLTNYKSNCENHWSVAESKACATVNIDVNGFKGPNNVGRDIFKFIITTQNGPTLYPAGGSDDGHEGRWINSGNKIVACYDKNTLGWECAGRIMEEGWQMNY